ncbi:MAG: DUF2272 domain-containing protein [Luteimonas sp.]|nr:DUF2272 domain-containing protein [Luteimonas sp.]
MPRIAVLLLLSWGGMLPASPASAADPCLKLPTLAAQSQEVPLRIAAAACEEHRRWYRPLIEADGRIGAMKVRVAERSRLADGQPAWRRVVDYWQGSGLLWRAGAGDCAQGDAPMPSCRAFVIDTPWSAAFVSWVMRKAAVPGFNGAASHLDYVRRAYREPFQSPYRVAHPLGAQVRAGDLLCYVRGTARTYGFGELATVLSGNEPGLAMHCDVVVGIEAGADDARSAFLVGGNVFDSVTMRRLRLTPGDRFDQLPMRLASDPECSPESPYACDLNRQDWSVLLQLRPADELAQLAPALPMPAATPAVTPGLQPASAPRCCNHCDPEVGLPRCPVTPPR